MNIGIYFVVAEMDESDADLCMIAEMTLSIAV
jgi:hypothetical protein